jgi:Fic family protein
MFRWDADALLPVVSRISSSCGMLIGQMSTLGFSRKGEAALQAMTDELVNSSSIEGVALNADSVRSSIARKLGIELDGSLATDHYVEGLVEVMLDAVTHCSEPLTAIRLFGWYHALFPSGRSGMYSIAVGRWREGEEPMQVVSGAFGHERVHYEAPPSEQVPAEMDKFLQWCNSATELPPFVKASVAHLWFVTIHPFDDGNGRICRTLTDMFLATFDGANTPRYYSMSAEINRRKREYYDALERAQHGTLDITEWMLWFMECLQQAVDNALSGVQCTLAKAEYWDRFAAVEVNERQRKVINKLWDGFDGNLTTSKWAKICHCSQDTALRDINDLIAKGMLRVGDSGGRSTHYVLAER